MHFFTATAALLFLVGGALFAGGAPEADPREGEEPAGKESVASQLEAIGVQPISREIQAEPFELATLHGPTVNLESYRGRLVLLNFWATWCAPCVLEMPSMQNLYNTFRDDGLEVVAVNMQESRDVVAAFVREHGFDFHILLDSTGRTAFDYAVRGLPTSYLIGREGELIGAKIGFHLWDEEEILETIRTLLEQET